MPLKLSIGSLSVTFDKFTNTDYPRIKVNPATVEYSAAGTVALGGPYHEQKHLWSFNCHCDRTQRNLIEAIAAEFDYRRRNLLDADILLEDTTSLLVERAPISRAMVQNTATDSIAEGYLCYYAKFKTAITDGPKFAEQGRLDILSLTLAETIKVVA
ncbi:hypothetical protein [Chroococcidiopsis sp.]|uniref:hypothetical protein n=1 Tax=Chroococcidiopsis sp. TaxID=3088168 RepID=UPI003F365511